MKFIDGLRRHGFRRWYERQLMQSHAHMLLAFLCFIGVLAAFELLDESNDNRLGNMLAILLCTAVGAWAVRRYIKLLSIAEAMANQADCPACKTYARFNLTEHRIASHEVKVHCKHCQHEWIVQDLTDEA